MQKISIGIDSGSRTTKIVIFQNNRIKYSNVVDTGVNPKTTSEFLSKKTLSNLEINKRDISKIYATGYGRKLVRFADKQVSEITCHARGVNFLFPEVRTVIDIGGQDSKVILVNEKGKVIDFVMNDKCAAGTGRFLEVVAHILELTVDELGKISLQSNEKINIDSTCVVFAESEIIGLISQGKKRADIIMSVHHSIAKRTKSFLSQLHWQKPVVFTGGVAKNVGMTKAISSVLNAEIIVPENSFITGALGAAIFASEVNG
ncbi:MAG TPA: 2-hydroxyglutaryl-CoA dehydratase [Candidatus Cloacimonetes bacterium]|nr:2-hydroxyglutaryl-CoA dehydratase [Candidatus Cloacimonadota bacterium]